jgi:hypothetical protein
MPYLNDVEIGQELPLLSKDQSRDKCWWNGVRRKMITIRYTDERVAAAMKLPGTPIQGTYKYALMGQTILRWLGSTGSLNRISARHKNMNLEGEVVTARARITDIEPGETAGRVTLEV